MRLRVPHIQGGYNVSMGYPHVQGGEGLRLRLPPPRLSWLVHKLRLGVVLRSVEKQRMLASWKPGDSCGWCPTVLLHEKGAAAGPLNGCGSGGLLIVDRLPSLQSQEEDSV